MKKIFENPGYVGMVFALVLFVGCAYYGWAEPNVHTGCAFGRCFVVFSQNQND